MVINGDRQPLVIRVVHGEIGDFHVERHSVRERHKPLGSAGCIYSVSGRLVCVLRWTISVQANLRWGIC